MVVIILGMHRSGTSLVSSMLHAAGVCMGEMADLRKAEPTQPRGYWEDHDFVVLNRRIIKAAGGHWHRPPPRTEILKAGQDFKPDIVALVDRKAKAARMHGTPWGWKDPRNCLAIELWHPRLHEPRYVRVMRDHDAIVDSLYRRGERLGGKAETANSREAWKVVIGDHYKRVKNFFIRYKPPHTTVYFEDLVNSQRAYMTTLELLRFIGLTGQEGAFERALAMIEFR